MQSARVSSVKKYYPICVKYEEKNYRTVDRWSTDRQKWGTEWIKSPHKHGNCGLEFKFVPQIVACVLNYGAPVPILLPAINFKFRRNLLVKNKSQGYYFLSLSVDRKWYFILKRENWQNSTELGNYLEQIWLESYKLLWAWCLELAFAWRAFSSPETAFLLVSIKSHEASGDENTWRGEWERCVAFLPQDSSYTRTYKELVS